MICYHLIDMIGNWMMSSLYNTIFATTMILSLAYAIVLGASLASAAEPKLVMKDRRYEKWQWHRRGEEPYL